jgi:hypothetical protein
VSNHDDSISARLAVDSAEKLQDLFPEPETDPIDAEAHQAVRAEHPEWFENKD